MSTREVLRHVSSFVTRYIHSTISLCTWIRLRLLIIHRFAKEHALLICQLSTVYLENVGNYCNIKLLLPHSQCKLEWHALAMTHDHIACSECSTNRPHSCIVDEFGFWNFEWIACAHYYYYYCSSLASESICSGLRKFLVDSVGWQVLALAIELTPFDYLTYFVWPIFLRIFPFCILSNFLSPLRFDWFLL